MTTCPPLLAPLVEPLTVRMVIVAINKSGEIVGPRTKKNHPVLIPRQKFPTLVPSPQYQEWERACLRTLQASGVIRHHGAEWLWLTRQPIDQPVNCKALIYRETLTGDAVGYYQAVGDMLEAAGIVANDKWFVSWDGSRLLKDPKRPRVEVTLTEVRE